MMVFQISENLCSQKRTVKLIDQHMLNNAMLRVQWAFYGKIIKLVVVYSRTTTQ